MPESTRLGPASLTRSIERLSNSDSRRLQFLLLALVTVFASFHGASAQPTIPSSILDPLQQRNSTGFGSPTCNSNANTYSYTVINGYATQVTFMVALECDGTSITTQPVTVPAFTQTESFNIPPSTGSVKNRLCELSLNYQDPFSTDPNPALQQFKSYTDTCGVVVNAAEVCKEDIQCEMGDLPCQYQSNQWYYSGMAYLVHGSLAFWTSFIVGSLLYLTQYRRAAAKRSAARKNSGIIEATKAKYDSVKTRLTSSSAYTKVRSLFGSPAAAAGMGKMGGASAVPSYRIEESQLTTTKGGAMYIAPDERSDKKKKGSGRRHSSKQNSEDSVAFLSLEDSDL